VWQRCHALARCDQLIAFDDRSRPGHFHAFAVPGGYLRGTAQPPTASAASAGRRATRGHDRGPDVVRRGAGGALHPIRGRTAGGALRTGDAASILRFAVEKFTEGNDLPDLQEANELLR
jgi:hypothetical protein